VTDDHANNLLGVLGRIADELAEQNALTKAAEQRWDMNRKDNLRRDQKLLAQARIDQSRHEKRAVEAQLMLQAQAKRQEQEHRWRKIEHEVNMENHEFAAIQMGLRAPDFAPEEDIEPPKGKGVQYPRRRD